MALQATWSKVMLCWHIYLNNGIIRFLKSDFWALSYNTISCRIFKNVSVQNSPMELLFPSSISKMTRSLWNGHAEKTPTEWEPPSPALLEGNRQPWLQKLWGNDGGGGVCRPAGHLLEDSALMVPEALIVWLSLYHVLILAQLSWLKLVGRHLICHVLHRGWSHADTEASAWVSADVSVPGQSPDHLGLGVTGTQTLLGLGHTFHSSTRWPVGLKTVLGIYDIFFFFWRACHDQLCWLPPGSQEPLGSGSWL